jgi:hypothetical protein
MASAPSVKRRRHIHTVSALGLALSLRIEVSNLYLNH